MKIISTIILLFFVAIPIVFGFGGQTKMRIDEIYNNTGDNIILKPSNKVGIDYLTGDKIIQSTAEGLLEESTVTTTELGYLSGVTSSVQDQISSKQDSITGTDGDLYYWNSGLSNLTIGTEGQFLKVSSLGFPEWVDLPTAVSVTTKGDLQTYSTQADRLPVGTDGQVLQANSATSTGLEWVDADFYTSPLTTEGDLLYRDATQDTRLPIGTEDQVLTVNASGLPVWADSKGGGGSAGINFVIDPSFEKNNLAFTNSLSGTTTYPLYTADDKLYSEFNEVYFQIAHTGLSAANYSTSYTVTRTGLDGKQGLVSIWAKTAAELDLCVDVDTNGCDTTLTLINDDTWRKYEVPIVFGTGNVLLKFVNASITGDVTLQLDNAYVGTMPDGYIQDVGQAHFVGSLIYSPAATCFWQVGTTSYSNFAAVPACNNVSVSGGVLTPTTAIPGLRIPNARVDGVYKVVSQGFFYLDGPGSDAEFTLSDGTTTSGYTTANSTSNARLATTLQGVFKFSTGGEKTIQIQGAAQSGSFASIYSSGFGRVLDFDVYFYPDDNSTIVSQNTELTAKTANEFSFNMDLNGNVTQDSYDFINGNCTKVNQGGYYQYNCPLNDLGITEKLQCAAMNTNGAGLYLVGYRSAASSTSQISFTTQFSSSNTILDAPISAVCRKADVDLNKSATIVGKFENINSSDIAIVEAYQVASQTLTDSTATPITFDTELFDNYNAYNTSTGEFTCPKVAKFKVSYNVYFQNLDTSSASTQLLDIRSSGVVRKELVRFNDVGINGDKNINGTGIIDCDSTSRVYTFNALCNDIDNTNCNTRAGTLGSVGYSNLSIHEIPDTESIVKNLSNQKTKCQTKVLSALTGSTGQIADLTFTGLDTNKNYSFVFKGNSEHINTISGDKYVYINTNDSSLQSDFQRALSTVLRFSHDIHSPKFKPASSTVYVNIILINAMYLLGGASATLCELPDTYVETTEF